MTGFTPEQRALMTNFIEASDYIRKYTVRGPVSYVVIPDEIIQVYADKKGMTFEKAAIHLENYFLGKTNEF